MVDPRETWHNCLACLGEVRSRLGLLPRLLERGEFCLISHLTIKGVMTYHPLLEQGDHLAQTRSEYNLPYVVLGCR